jgi:putative transposase
MTATLDAMAASKKDKPEPAAEQKLAEELVARAREQGVSLTGPDGLLKQLTKTVLETALNQPPPVSTKPSSPLWAASM